MQWWIQDFPKGLDHENQSTTRDGQHLVAEPWWGSGGKALKLKAFLSILIQKEEPKVKDLNDSSPRVRGRLLLTVRTSGQWGMATWSTNVTVRIYQNSHAVYYHAKYHNERSKSSKSTLIMTGLIRMMVHWWQVITASTGFKRESVRGHTSASDSAFGRYCAL